ncbi:MAG: hypothetical protein ACKPAD_15940, partial [Bacteroidota bacterium]
MNSFFRSIALSLICVVGSVAAYGQGNATLFGTVRDAAGKPLPGVNVAVLGKSGGMATPGDGKYSIIVPSD